MRLFWGFLGYIMYIYIYIHTYIRLYILYFFGFLDEENGSKWRENGLIRFHQGSKIELCGSCKRPWQRDNWGYPHDDWTPTGNHLGNLHPNAFFTSIIFDPNLGWLELAYTCPRYFLTRWRIGVKHSHRKPCVVYFQVDHPISFMIIEVCECIQTYLCIIIIYNMYVYDTGIYIYIYDTYRKHEYMYM